MKLLLDENIPKSLYKELNRRRYDALYIPLIKRGLKDKEIIEIANNEDRAIITLDQDFIYLSKYIKTKIILIRRKFKKEEIPKLADSIEKALSIKEKIIIIRENYIESIK